MMYKSDYDNPIRRPVSPYTFSLAIAFVATTPLKQIGFHSDNVLATIEVNKSFPITQCCKHGSISDFCVH